MKSAKCRTVYDMETETNTIYTETTGTTVLLDGQRGTLTGLHRTIRPGVTAPTFDTVGAFVRLDGPTDPAGRYMTQGPMLYVALGAQVGDRGERHEVTGWRVIDRDEFDRITELNTLRVATGWK